ncbi:ABC transporter ATP-binding protein [Allostreptomyces psammosilenae]|uniref:Putative ABC transport system ATP-binding protein n=1 Tax=Allostreptomyces psammosilenae TaxID=1892865 RepID=A0A853A112_9ACTN|nr:ABC transporter ATP-binding protein [Allostreptomyces psammosilenae]NYI07140.1 putative ABC transport system ATP-binding protein [Allostreptomyces psammosilenae]
MSVHTAPTRPHGADQRPPESGWATLRRALGHTPEFTQGLPLTLLLALLATVGRIVVPVAVQQTIDNGIAGAGGPDLDTVRAMVALATGAVVLTAVATWWMNLRLYRSSERGLASLRTRAFRHIHDLSVLHQAAHMRGSLVSRVTGDVDTVSRFVQQGGVILVISVGQVAAATAIMLVYSWQLTLWVWFCFLPLVLLLRTNQRRLATAYAAVRERVGAILATVSEAVVGAAAVRAHAIERRTLERADAAIDAHLAAQDAAQRRAVSVSILTEVVAGVAIGGVLVAGTLLGVDGGISLGGLVAFLFLVSLFVTPVQSGVELLTETQNALAGWRRVLQIMDTEPDVSDPARASGGAAARASGAPAGRPGGTPLPAGPLSLRFEGVGFAYPGGATALRELDLEIPAGRRIAVVGETGSGKTTFAKLLTRLMDPTSGRILLGGVPLPEVSFAELRGRVVMVPQDGFLFDSTIAGNVRYGRPDATDEEIRQAAAELGLADWLDGLPHGVRTPVGQRGESLSAGERQLVALLRAHVAGPELLLLDEATSAVDPATETRLTGALERLAGGRTAITIAHRLSTARAADEVLVFDSGRLVERGPHAELVGIEGGVYARLHASWIAQRRPVG